MHQFQILVYETENGKEPFTLWLQSLKDHKIVEHVMSRIDRARFGNFGDVKSIGRNLKEFRIHYSKGYRIYFGVDGNTIVILLNGGDKKSQKRDIEKAKEYWKDYKEAVK